MDVKHISGTLYMYVIWTETYNLHFCPWLVGGGDGSRTTIFYETIAEASRLVEKFQRSYGHGFRYEIQEVLTADWTIRESSKFETGEYTNPVWHEQHWYLKRKYILNAFDHVSRVNPAHIAFTENAAKGEANRVTSTTPGRFLTRFFADVLSAREIERWAGLHRETYESPPELLWARTPEEIEAVYSMNAAFGSCMQRPGKSWGKKIGHPTRVYGAGDLAVAYIKDSTRLLARALVWEDKKRVGRVYGNGDALRGALAKYGIHTKSTSSTYDTMEGAKLLRIQVGTFNKKGQTVPRVVGPYLDGNANCATSLDDNYLQITTGKNHPQFHGSNQDGQYYGYPKCDGCDTYTDDIYTTWTKEDDEIVSKCACYNCQNKNGIVIRSCALTGTYYVEGKFTLGPVYDSGRRGSNTYNLPIELLLHRKEIFKSDISGSYYPKGYLAKTGDGKIITTSEAIDNYFISAMDGVYYPKSDMLEFGSRKFSNTQVKQIMQYDLFNPIMESIAA